LRRARALGLLDVVAARHDGARSARTGALRGVEGAGRISRWRTEQALAKRSVALGVRRSRRGEARGATLSARGAVWLGETRSEGKLMPAALASGSGEQRWQGTKRAPPRRRDTRPARRSRPAHPHCPASSSNAQLQPAFPAQDPQAMLHLNLRSRQGSNRNSSRREPVRRRALARKTRARAAACPCARRAEQAFLPSSPPLLPLLHCLSRSPHRQLLT
jgi:hypothetical protein